MPYPPVGAVDCDLHPAVPSIKALLPYLDDHWRDMVIQRGVHELDSISYPKNAPISARPDWKPEVGKAGQDLVRLRKEALDGFGTKFAICNCLYGVQLLYTEDMAYAFSRAVNDWIATEWLDKEPRLRASIVVSPQNPDYAAAEIDRMAVDKRFVQVLMLVMDEMPLGRRRYWPIYRAAERNGLPVGIHAGSAYRHPVTSVGWPTYYAEDSAAQSQAFQTTLTSLITEGVFAEFPELKVVLLESGFAWLPAHLWRLGKFWRGLRMEIPWVDRHPLEIAKDHVRLTIQPYDAPPRPDDLEKLIEHFDSDEMLLFSSDYPHWHYEGNNAIPDGISKALQNKICYDNPLATYPRLKEAVT
jgi:predicted TIM-barrel fold metal-dependent hydrolase